MKNIAPILLIVACTAISSAQNPLEDASLSSDTRSVNQIYVIDRDGIPVYANSRATSGAPSSVKMGELYFGMAKENGRVRLSKYSDIHHSFVEQLGWVDERHLLTANEPMTVGTAVSRGGLHSDIVSNSAAAYTSANALSVRVVAKPEKEIWVASAPGLPGEHTGLNFTWYYVYDVEQVENDWYYLIGTEPRLFNTRFLTDTNSATAKHRLLGWIQEQYVQAWCSNVVLEYNASSKGVRERVVANDDGTINLAASQPAVLRRRPSLTAPVTIVEPLDDFWSGALADRRPSQPGVPPLASFDPIGFVPEVPRFHVLEKTDNWLRVASLGSIKGEPIGQTEIAHLLKQISDINQSLRKVDVVFVVDATGSMADEIEVLGNWLTDLCKRFAELAEKNDSFPIAVRGRTLRLDTWMNIRTSLVLYQDIAPRKNSSVFTSKAVFQNVYLHKPSHRDFLKGQFKTLDKTLVKGKNEALHAGLLHALDSKQQADQFWRDDAQVRIIIVVADEQGDTGDAEQRKVLAAMPLPPDDRTKSGIDSDAYKRAFTLLYGIYTRKEGFAGFKNNLRMLVSDTNTQILHAPEFRKGHDQAQQQLIEMLYEPIANAQNLVQRNTADFLQRLQRHPDRTSPAKISRRPSSGIMTDIAVRAAMKSAGVRDPAALRAITNVAYTEGYALIQQPEHSEPTFRFRTALTRADADELRDIMERLARGLDRALDPRRQDIARPPQLIIAEALVMAIAEVQGNASQVENPDRLRNEAAKLLIRLKNGDANLRSVLRVRESLPINPTGLLGMPAGQLLNMNLRQLAYQEDALHKKAKCLRNMINGETAPENVDDIETHVAQMKQWVYTHPQSRIEFYYVPLQYLP